MRLSPLVLHALRGGVVGALAVGCGASAPAQSTTTPETQAVVVTETTPAVTTNQNVSPTPPTTPPELEYTVACGRG